MKPLVMVSLLKDVCILFVFKNNGMFLMCFVELSRHYNYSKLIQKSQRC